MRHNRLLNLLASNRRKGEFRAETGEGGNTIYLYDQIVATEDDVSWFGGVAADTFVKTLLGMDGPVLLRINSPGGDVFAARAMAQAIREYSGQVTARVDGYAASAASFITSVADRTEMAPGSMLMIHKAMTVGWGNADEHTATANLLNKVDGTIAATYAVSLLPMLRARLIRRPLRARRKRPVMRPPLPPSLPVMKRRRKAPPSELDCACRHGPTG